ncbi:MAG: methylenetetrahydrofolate reductase [NAD(P)H] [Actinobacteria bacterium]|nr:methylenetetrahydrofolate reductase [NAD(P)H] [Actinomycetota bacterium]
MDSVPTFSVEFFPPKDQAGEERLWGALKALELYKPDFVSVTYGAGGSTRDRTVRITSEITSRSGISTIAHLTCVGSSKDELVEILKQYRGSGIKSILALRGDPKGGPGVKWESTAGGFDHADQLVSLASQMGFEVGVAAFPDGHPASNGNYEQDIEVLLEKERRGARFATTQFFFDIKGYFNLVNEIRAFGSRLDIYPGILPITNRAQLKKMAELGGTPIPSDIQSRVERAGERSADVARVGIDIASELSKELLESGVPGLHFYTMNSATPTIEIIKRIGLR